MLQVFYKAEVGFEPTNRGFAIRSLSPLGYSAVEGAGYLAFGCMAIDTSNSSAVGLSPGLASDLSPYSQRPILAQSQSGSEPDWL